MGKTSTQHTTQDIDPQLREESDITTDAGRILAGGMQDRRYKGNTIAAPSAATSSAWAGANAASDAFGMPTASGNVIPEGTADSRGIMGFSPEETMQNSGSVDDEMNAWLGQFYDKIGQQARDQGPIKHAGGGGKK